MNLLLGITLYLFLSFFLPGTNSHGIFPLPFIVLYVKFCGLMVRAPGYTTEMYCDFCEVRTEFVYVM
jgi:hypothetical protein